MGTRNGFPRMDWDTGFLSDPKFLHLRDLLPDPVQFGYAGFCYLRLVSDAWRTCERRPIRDVVRGIEVWAVTALHEAGLIEDAFILSESSYEQWIGSAIERRHSQGLRQKKHRESRDVTVTNGDSPSVTPRHEVARYGRDGRDSSDVEGEPEREDGRDDLEAWLLAKHRIPTPRQREWLDRYCDTFDVTGPQRAAKIILSHPDDPIAALKADRDAFLHERAEAITIESKPSSHRSGSGLTGVSAELAKMWRQQEEGEA